MTLYDTNGILSTLRIPMVLFQVPKGFYAITGMISGKSGQDNKTSDMSSSLNTLWYMHLGAGLLHLGTAIATFVMVYMNESEIRKWPIVHYGFNGPPVKTWEVQLGYYLPAFSGLSAMNHLVAVTMPQFYQDILKKQVNPVRWSEFAFSSGIMLVIIGLLSGCNDTKSLVQLCLLNVLLMYCGYLLEVRVAEGKSPRECMDLLLIAWGLFSCIWMLLFTSFFTVTAEFDAPPAVYTIIFGLFILYGGFGILNALHVWKLIDFTQVETGFISLSLLAKSLLSSTTFLGVLNANVGYEATPTPSITP